MRRLAAVLGLVLSLAVQADVDIRRDDGSRRNPSKHPGSEILQLYFSLSELSLEDQRQQMWALSSKTKAVLWTLNIERYLRDHPELSAEAQDVLRTGIALVTTPAWFDIVEGSFGYELKTSALEEFTRRLQSTLAPETINEVFIRLGPEPFSLPPAAAETPTGEPRFGNRIPRADIYGCTCSGMWECGFFPHWECAASYCDPMPHCGIFGNQECWGRCKSTGV